MKTAVDEENRPMKKGSNRRIMGHCKEKVQGKGKFRIII
jgi:hypothetical protein